MLHRTMGITAGILLHWTIGSFTAQAAPIVIDDFETGAFEISWESYPASQVVIEGLDPAHTITGKRSIYVGGATGNATGAMLSPDNPDVADDGIVFNSEGTPQNSLRLEYFGQSHISTPDIDLTAGGNDRIRITLAAAPAVGTLRVEARGLHPDLEFASLVQPITGAGVYDFLFADFLTGSSGPSASLSHFTGLDILKVAIIDPGGGDPVTFILSDIRAVPEPSALSLLALTTLLAVTRRSRR